MRLNLVAEHEAPFAVVPHVLFSVRLFLLDDVGLSKCSVALSSAIHIGT